MHIAGNAVGWGQNRASGDDLGRGGGRGGCGYAWVVFLAWLVERGGPCGGERPRPICAPFRKKGQTPREVEEGAKGREKQREGCGDGVTRGLFATSFSYHHHSSRVDPEATPLTTQEPKKMIWPILADRTLLTMC